MSKLPVISGMACVSNSHYGNNTRSWEAGSLILSFSNLDKKAFLMLISSTYTLK